MLQLALSSSPRRSRYSAAVSPPLSPITASSSESTKSPRDIYLSPFSPYDSFELDFTCTEDRGEYVFTVDSPFIAKWTAEGKSDCLDSPTLGTFRRDELHPSRKTVSKPRSRSSRRGSPKAKIEQPCQCRKPEVSMTMKTPPTTPPREQRTSSRRINQRLSADGPIPIVLDTIAEAKDSLVDSKPVSGASRSNHFYAANHSPPNVSQASKSWRGKDRSRAREKNLEPSLVESLRDSREHPSIRNSTFSETEYDLFEKTVRVRCPDTSSHESGQQRRKAVQLLGLSEDQVDVLPFIMPNLTPTTSESSSFESASSRSGSRSNRLYDMI